MDWKDLEHALVRIAYQYGFKLDIGAFSGDKIAVGAINVDDTEDDLNLTELAKDIARELER